MIKNQAVECATKVSEAFSSGTGDGLLGLAFSLINTVRPEEKAITPVQMMNSEGVTPPVPPHPSIVAWAGLNIWRRALSCSLVNSHVTLKNLDTIPSVCVSTGDTKCRIY